MCCLTRLQACIDKLTEIGLSDHQVWTSCGRRSEADRYVSLSPTYRQCRVIRTGRVAATHGRSMAWRRLVFRLSCLPLLGGSRIDVGFSSDDSAEAVAACCSSTWTIGSICSNCRPSATEQDSDWLRCIGRCRDHGTHNAVEADPSQLKHRLRPMRGLRTDRTAQVIIAGHAFMQNLRRGTLRTRCRRTYHRAHHCRVGRTRTSDLTPDQAVGLTRPTIR